MQTIKYLYTAEQQVVGELKYSSKLFSDYSKHFHTHLGIALIEKGSLEITFEEGKMTLDNHSIAIFNPHQIHCSNPVDTEGYYVLFLNNQWCQEIKKDFFFSQNIIDDQELYTHLKEIFHQILNSNKITPHKNLYKTIRELFLSHATVQKKREKDLIVQVKEYIHSHSEEALSVSDVAKYVGYDKSYLIRFFSQEVGMTPQQYILNEKVNRAKDLLSYSQLKNLSDVAVHAGFFDQSHLNRNFKPLFGTTPKKYKIVNIVQDK